VKRGAALAISLEPPGATNEAFAKLPDGTVATLLSVLANRW
jgi:hypothetical protein